MENEQYLYFAISKKRFEQVTSKRKSILNEDIYDIKVKEIHSCWLDHEFEFSTEIFAESQNYVLLRTTVKWYDYNIKSLTMKSGCLCEICYESDSRVIIKYYTDKNLKDAFRDHNFKVLDKYSEVKKYLYFIVKQSALDKLAYRTNENHYSLQVGSNREFGIGCDVINRNNESDPYVMLRSTDVFQNSIYLKDAIKSFENDNTVIGNRGICKLYYNKYVLPDPSLCHNMTAFMRYFTDEDLKLTMLIYDFEEKDTEDSPVPFFASKPYVGINVTDLYPDYPNNKITKENKDMPPYKHHIINPGTLGLYFGDCSSVHSGVIQEAKHVTVKDIKFNGPATIIFYEDGSKEVVKCQKNDKVDKEKAIYMAMLKHKNKKLYSIINKALSSEDPEKTLAYEFIKYEGGDVKLLHQLCNDAIKAEKPKKKIKKNNAKVATKKTNKKSKEDK